LEADSAAVFTEALQELGLADPAATVEDEELWPAALIELFEEFQLLRAS